MAAKNKPVMQNRSPKESSVLHRVFQLPVVNSALTNLQRTYASAKEIHPLMASVCATYERALQNASSLALWSVKPVVQKLEPRLAAANVLACQGLDHLEKRIPVLQKPVEKATSDLKDTILAHLHCAICSVMDILDKVLGLAAENDEQSDNSVKIKTENVKSSQVNQVAKASAVSKLENVVDWKMEPSSAYKSPGGCVSKKVPSTSTFGSIRSLAAAVSQLAFRQSSQAIQFTKDKGVKLAMWISYLKFLGLVEPVNRFTSSLFLPPSIHQLPFPKVVVKEEEATAMVVVPPEPCQEGEGVQPVTPDSRKHSGASQLQERRSSRGHYPLPFLNLDEPLTPHQSPAFEAEYSVARKSAFSPYKEGSSSRRWSEGLFRPSLDATYARAHYTGLYSTALKKD
ncbi:perilipin-1 [Candoia aspera]|uniref:perilipin-1 n=1 Tax=Candoia aspera TaxID=51853 RepID=UPI002FD7F0C3